MENILSNYHRNDFIINRSTPSISSKDLQTLNENWQKIYKEEIIDIKNGYSMSFEDLSKLESNMDRGENNDVCDDKSSDYDYEDADICDVSDDCTPLGKIHKKNKKTFYEKMITYTAWFIGITGLFSMMYFTMTKLYRE